MLRQVNFHFLSNLLLRFWLATFLPSARSLYELDFGLQLNATDTAIQFMQQNLSKALTVEKIAQSVHLSNSGFSKKFKQETGYAPKEYFNYLRIQKACQLLILVTIASAKLRLRSA